MPPRSCTGGTGGFYAAGSARSYHALDSRDSYDPTALVVVAAFLFRSCIEQEATRLTRLLYLNGWHQLAGISQQSTPCDATNNAVH